MRTMVAAWRRNLSGAKLHRRATQHRALRVVSGDSVRAAVGPYDATPMTLIGDGRFSCADVTQWMIDAIGCRSLTISAWSVGLSEAAWLGTLALASDVHVIVDRSWPTRHAEFCRALVAAVGAQRVRVARCHAKMICIEGADGHLVAVRSSANFNPNPRIEQWDIDPDAGLYAMMRQTLMDASLPLGASTPQVDAAFGATFGCADGLESADLFDLTTGPRFE